MICYFDVSYVDSFNRLKKIQKYTERNGNKYMKNCNSYFSYRILDPTTDPSLLHGRILVLTSLLTAYTSYIE